MRFCSCNPDPFALRHRLHRGVAVLHDSLVLVLFGWSRGVIELNQKGYRHLAAFGTARWAEPSDLERAGMLARAPGWFWGGYTSAALAWWIR